MSGMKQRLLARLEGLGVDEEQIASGLAQVIKGETTMVEKDGAGNIKKTRVTTKPDDVMFGLMLFDSLHEGELGLAPKSMIKGKDQIRERVHKRLNVDQRVLVNADPADGEEEVLVTSGTVKEEAPTVLDSTFSSFGSDVLSQMPKIEIP